MNILESTFIPSYKFGEEKNKNKINKNKQI